MVIFVPALTADRREVAPRTVLAGPWVRLWPLLHMPAQPTLRSTEVGIDLRWSISLDGLRSKNNVDAFWSAPLDRCYCVRVPRELEHRGGLRRAGEFGVMRL